MTNDSITANGGNGGNGSNNSGSPGGNGGAGGSIGGIAIAGTQGTALNGFTINSNVGSGGNGGSGAIVGGNGGNAGSAGTVALADNIALNVNNSAFNLMGGNGGTGGDGNSPGTGGTGGTASSGSNLALGVASSSGTLTVSGSSANTSGGAGGGGVAKIGGNGGNIALGSVNNLSVSNSTFTSQGGDGGVAVGTNTGGAGGIGGTVDFIASNTANDNAVTVNNSGGKGGNSTNGTAGNGGNGGAINFAGTLPTPNTAPNTIVNSGVTLTSNGGNGGNSSTSTGGNGGNGGLIKFSANDLTITNGSISAIGGAAGTGTPNGTAGTATGWQALANNITLIKTGAGFFDVTGADNNGLGFTNEAQNALPHSFTYQQDDTVTDETHLPVITQFFNNGMGNLLGMLYTVHSVNGDFHLVTTNKLTASNFSGIAGGNVYLDTPIVIADGFTGLFFAAGNNVYLNNVDTNLAPQSYTAGNTNVLTADTHLNTNGGALFMTGLLGGGHNLVLNTGAGDITFSNFNASPSAFPLTDVTVESANNILGGLLSVASFTQETGTGTTNFNNTLNSAGSISISTNFITGNYIGGATFLDGFSNDTASVNVSSLLLAGAKAKITGFVGGAGGGEAAQLTQVVPSVRDFITQFTVNDCIVTLGCSLPQAIFNNLYQTQYGAQTPVLKPRSFNPDRGGSNQIAGEDCVPITVSKTITEQGPAPTFPAVVKTAKGQYQFPILINKIPQPPIPVKLQVTQN